MKIKRTKRLRKKHRNSEERKDLPEKGHGVVLRNDGALRGGRNQGGILQKTKENKFEGEGGNKGPLKKGEKPDPKKETKSRGGGDMIKVQNPPKQVRATAKKWGGGKQP